ncbi:MAG: hypothetical protein ABJG15_04095 [Hyphomonadaceae bacterium]
MARLFFGLLLILGLGAAGFGGLQLFGDGAFVTAPAPAAAPVEPVVAPPPPPPPPPAPAASVEPPPADEPMFSTSALPPAGLPQPVIARSLPAPVPAVEDTLREVPVAYEVPATASFGTVFDVTFALDATGAATATAGLPGLGEVVEASANVSDRVKASLVGAAFDIDLQSPEIQLLGNDEANTWRWRVTPKESGEQVLFVELFAMIGEDARPVRTLNDTVTVEVTRFQKAVSLATAANPLAVFLGGIGSTLGGLFGFFRFLGRRS